MEYNALTYLQKLPFCEHLTDAERERIRSNSYIREFAKDSILHDHNSDCLGMVVLISGRLRVTMQSEDAKEVTIYLMDPGDVDILSASCVINQLTFDTVMTADEDSQVLVIPASVMSKLKEDNIYVSNYVYELSTMRFSDAMWTLQQILFLKIDQRIANVLLDEYARTDQLKITLTQEKVARNIGSTREVVARVIKQMEREHLVKLGRGCIEILDTDALEALL